MSAARSSIFRIEAWGDPVGVGASGAVYCTLQGVAKQNKPNEPFLVANEFICGRLALMLGLPVPPTIIVQAADASLAHVMLRFGKAGERPPPANVSALVTREPELAGAMIAFDVWIGNTDRHNGNFAYEPDLIPLTLFDHSHALFGPGADGINRLKSSRDAPAFGSCLANEVTTVDHVGKWAGRIDAMHAEAIHRVCAEVRDLGGLTAEAHSAAVDFLVHRKGKVFDMLRSTPAALPKVQQWVLA